MNNKERSCAATAPWSSTLKDEPNQVISWCSSTLPAVVETSNPNLINSYNNFPSYSEPIRSTLHMAETPNNNCNGNTNLASLPETYNGGFLDQSYSLPSQSQSQVAEIPNKLCNGNTNLQEQNYDSGSQILSFPGTDDNTSMNNKERSSAATAPRSSTLEGEQNQVISWCSSLPALVDTSNPNLINSYNNFASYSEPIRSALHMDETSNPNLINSYNNFPSYSEPIRSALHMVETPNNNCNGNTNLAPLPETYNGGFLDQSYSLPSQSQSQVAEIPNNLNGNTNLQEQNYDSGNRILSFSGTNVNWSMMNTGDNDNANFMNTLPRKVKHDKWSEDEHKLFLWGVANYGWGNWRIISRRVLSTRTASQIASHAQKYQHRQNIPETSRKRKSIHDINKISSGSFTILVSPPNIPQSQ